MNEVDKNSTVTKEHFSCVHLILNTDFKMINILNIYQPIARSINVMDNFLYKFGE